VTGRGPLPALLGAVVDAARVLPGDHVRRLAEGLRQAGHPGNAGELLDRPPTLVYRSRASAVLHEWHAQPDLSGERLADLLDGAQAGYSTAADEQRVDLVWSGPSTGRVPVRLASQVVLDLVNQAQRELLLVSFAAYRVAYLRVALTAAAARGVVITMVLESKEASGKKLSQDAALAFRGIGGITVLEWPHAKRPPVGDGVAVMHAKVAVADADAALVTSTNLTEAGLDHNMECGLLVRGGPVPASLRDHFRALRYAGELVVVTS
jgi:phosphatidylserine/phosphatidylglycerophosphate/cardiolipin synthase-like enzyme